MPYEVSGDLLCWSWTGYVDPEGRPRVRTKTGKTTGARWHWEREVGPIPEGKVLVALCGNIRCVRPHHHEPVTRAELAQIKGSTVLDPRTALRALLMRKDGVGQREVGRRLGVSAKTISNIERGLHWTVRKGAQHEHAA